MDKQQSWTGERLETFVFNENTNEHLHRYAITLNLVKGKKVLDIACGEGYGSNLMAAYAAEVTGVDIDEETVMNARGKYNQANLDFLVGRADKIPCESNNFDIVISFETIEHHDKHHEMMAEINRVLKPGGLLVISSPDKLYYSDKTGYRNPFHVKELYEGEFNDLLKKHFKNVSLLKQKFFVGSVIISQDNALSGDSNPFYNGGYDGIEEAEFGAVYLVGIVSNGEIPVFNTSFFNGEAVLKQQFIDFQKLVTDTVRVDVTKEITDTRTYQVGEYIMSRWYALKKLFKGK